MRGHGIESRSKWMSVRAGALGATIAVAASLVCLLFARHALETAFGVYDDEGYMLLSFQHYFAGGHLYTEVASEYGPFNFFAERALFQILHLPVNLDAGRIVTLICWLFSALLGGCFTYKLSKNTILASSAGLATMVLGRVLASEPGHPQQLILPLLLLACCASLFRGRIALLLLGAIGAALFFTKINAGVFYFAAIAQTFLCGFPAGRIRKIGAGLLFFYSVCGPLILMRQNLPGWAGGYCLVAIVCGVSTLAAALLTTPCWTKPSRGILYVTAGALPTAALIVAETMREGMSTSTLLDGVLWAPLRHPQIFSMPLDVSMMSGFAALLVSACIVALVWFRDRWLAHVDWLDALRCLIGLCAISQVTFFRAHYFFVAFLPLGLIPAKGRAWQPAESFPRLFVTSLAATEFLQAYPVAASQLSIQAAPLLLWAFVCVHDGAAGLFRLLKRAANGSGVDAARQESILGAVVAFAFALVMVGLSPWSYPTPPSLLQGSAALHLPSNVEARYEALAGDIRANCSMLFTMPGMGSLNFWSGVPAPNGLNLPSWVRAFNLEQQEEILHILELNPRSCAVYSATVAHLRGLTMQDYEKSPLANYILYSMPEVFEDGGYEIRVNPRRNAPWVAAAARPPS